MVIEFSVKNYRSFRGEYLLSLVASNYDKSLPTNLMAPELPGLHDLQLNKAAAIYGPNAGGKTNLLLALRYLKWLVMDSASGQKPNAKLPASGFGLDQTSLNEPTLLSLTFVAGDYRYELAVAVSPQRIVQERLVAYPPKGHVQTWYDRVWDEESEQYEWSDEKPKQFKLDAGIVGKTRENALYLSTAAQWNDQQILPVYRWFAEQLVFLDLSALAQPSNNFTAEMVNHSETACKQITECLRSAGLGLAGVEAREQATVEPEQYLLMNDASREAGSASRLAADKSWRVTFQHTGRGDQTYDLNWNDESAGTKRFFSILGPWLMFARTAQVLCVDELETSLHPSLVAELLRLFFKLTGSDIRSQLLFTTQNPLLLDTALLRRDQIWFVDKNREGESFLYPLTDYKPRADESLLRGYLGGRYGAVPFIPNGLASESEPAGQPLEVGNAG